LDTPGTPISRGRIVQRASTDCSISDSRSDDIPNAMARLDEETGSSITGGFDTLGSACDWVIFSATSWRARYRSVPGSKIITIDESPGIESERISSRNATPLSRSASCGTVISCSTSAADRPSASVWIST
jgi:hypothetical protein